MRNMMPPFLRMPFHLSTGTCAFLPVDVDRTVLLGDCAYIKKSHGIPGDGRCLFRSVVHGASLRLGKPSPSESHQKVLADELRAKVADEFVKRRADTEWFLECDFESYIQHIRKPHTWGGEPELLMASHVLKMPITVYMRERNSESLIVISQYGQEYGREDPIRVLYHGYGHYDALQVSPNGAQTKWFSKRWRRSEN